MNGFVRHTVASRAVVALLALALLPASLVSAAPAPPRFVVSDLTDQGGVYDGVSKFNSGWFGLSVANDGSSTYTQMSLTVAPDDPTVVARAALDATKAVPTPSSLCTISGNVFTCRWPTNLGGGQTTSPILFIFGAPSGTSYNVAAALTIKDRTTTSGGGSVQERDVTVTNLIRVNVSAREDQQTPYILPNSSPITVSTWKQGNVGQRASLLLPSSSTGYLTVLQEFVPGAEPEIPEACGADLASGFGQLVYARVNNGVRIDPYLQWTIEVTFGKGVEPPPATGVSHCVLVGTTYDSRLISVDPVDACPSGTTIPENGCLVWSKNQPYGIKVSGPKNNPANQNWTYTFVVRTKTNYLLKPKAS